MSKEVKNIRYLSLGIVSFLIGLVIIPFSFGRQNNGSLGGNTAHADVAAPSPAEPIPTPTPTPTPAPCPDG